MFQHSSASATEGSSTQFIGLFYKFSFLLAGRTHTFVTRRCQIYFILQTTLLFLHTSYKLNIIAKRIYLLYTERAHKDFIRLHGSLRERP